MRDLITIIDKMLEIAPEIKDKFSSLRESVKYTAPEKMILRWRECTEILIAYGKPPHITKEQQDQLVGVYNDTEKQTK